MNERLWLSFLVGLFTLLANATYSIGNDLRLQGQNNAIKPNEIIKVTCVVNLVIGNITQKTIQM